MFLSLLSRCLVELPRLDLNLGLAHPSTSDFPLAGSRSTCGHVRSAPSFKARPMPSFLPYSQGWRVLLLCCLATHAMRGPFKYPLLFFSAPSPHSDQTLRHYLTTFTSSLSTPSHSGWSPTAFPLQKQHKDPQTFVHCPNHRTPLLHAYVTSASFDRTEHSSLLEPFFLWLLQYLYTAPSSPTPINVSVPE